MNATKTAKPLGIILAGGLARRMGGGDKCLLQLGNETILERVVVRLNSQVEAVALNANNDVSRFSDFDLKVLPDSIGGFLGPLAGVLAGMEWAALCGVTTIVTVAGDTPFFPNDLVSKLQCVGSGMKYPVVLAATQKSNCSLKRHPTFGLWAVGLRDDLRKSLENGIRKITLWTDKHNGREAIFSESDTENFFNINSPQDLMIAERML
ncbi:MAG: molybdenum cofactor guanylyltransferase MobA [Aestuariivita sp.]|nr:molybdenum cofactor guanylyltransferase MobA [Aestuariivita sp.]